MSQIGSISGVSSPYPATIPGEGDPPAASVSTLANLEVLTDVLDISSEALEMLLETMAELQKAVVQAAGTTKANAVVGSVLDILA